MGKWTARTIALMIAGGAFQIVTLFFIDAIIGVGAVILATIALITAVVCGVKAGHEDSRHRPGN